MAQLDTQPDRGPFAGWPMVVFGAMMGVFALYASTHMVAAGDTWVALACGRHFVNHGVDTVEPFSFNSHKPGPTAEQVAQWPGWARKIVDIVGLETVKKWHPTGWINQNWLTHVLFYRLVTGFGSPDEPHYNALVYWKFAIYLLTVAAIYALGRTLGVSVPGAAAAAALAMVVGRTFLDIRPAGFSNLLVPVYLLVLALAVRRHVRWIWLIVPITVLWANVHGGYLYVFVMMVPFVALHALGLVLPAERVVRLNRRQDLGQIVGAGLVAFAAMVLFNPFHFTNLTHTFEISVSKHAESWRSVNEWHPAFEWSNPVGESFPFLVFFVLAIVAVIGWLGARLFRPLPLEAPIRRVKVRDAWFAAGLPVYGTAVILAGGIAAYITFSVIDTSAANIALAAVFLLILVMAAFWSVHFIYFAALLVLITLAFSNNEPGYAGRYIWPFMMVPTYVAIRATAPLFPRRSPYRPTDLAVVAATAVVTLLAMLAMFDPFGAGGFGKALAGLAHLQRPWQPRFEFQGGRTEPFHYPHYFAAIYGLNVLAAVGYLTWPYLRIWVTGRTARPNAEANTEPKAKAAGEPADRPFVWPPIDLAMLAIAALTVYMALKSRRFIPIAAAAAAPIVALFVEQAWAMLVARMRFATQRRLAVPVLTEPWRRGLIGVAGVVTLAAAAVWGAKYKRIYLDPWPADDIRDSVFMRMTASNVKPFDVCTFIRDNHVSGRVFNYWTEGGAIAWGQTPDPETGKTPLQLFMDGRAQAAYNHDKFELWRYIKGGGEPIGRFASQPGKVIRTGSGGYLNLTLDDYRQIGEWIDQTLKKMQVWVVLMPTTEVPYPQVSVQEINPESKYYFVKGLQVIGHWVTAYMDDNQHLLVDVETPQGKALMDKVLNGKAVFPNEYSRHLTLANALLRYTDRQLAQKGFEHAKRAFALRKTQAAAMKLAYEAPRHAELVQPAAEVLRAYLDDFLDHHDQYAREGGYAQRLLAALIGARRLAGLYAKTDPERARRYRQFEQQYHTRPRELALEAKW